MAQSIPNPACPRPRAVVVHRHRSTVRHPGLIHCSPPPLGGFPLQHPRIRRQTLNIPKPCQIERSRAHRLRCARERGCAPDPIKGSRPSQSQLLIFLPPRVQLPPSPVVIPQPDSIPYILPAMPHNVGPSSGDRRAVKVESANPFEEFSQTFPFDFSNNYYPCEPQPLQPFYPEYYTPDMLFILDEPHYASLVVPPPASLSVASTPMSPPPRSLPFVSDQFPSAHDFNNRFSPSMYSPESPYSSLPTYESMPPLVYDHSDPLQYPSSPMSPSSALGYLSSPQLSTLSSPSPRRPLPLLPALPMSASAPNDSASELRGMRRAAATQAAEAISIISPNATSAPISIPVVTKRSRGRQVPTVASISHSVRGVGSKTVERQWICEVNGCGKCFVRSEHLHRHHRSIHTLDRRTFLSPFIRISILVTN